MPSHFTQIKAQKRARPTTPNPVFEQHKQIVSHFSISQPNSNLLNDSIYQSNINKTQNVTSKHKKQTKIILIQKWWN